MKKKIMFLTAVLLFAVLLFFLKEKGVFPQKEGKSGTPTPVAALPRELKNVWILSSTENSITFFFEGKEMRNPFFVFIVLSPSEAVLGCIFFLLFIKIYYISFRIFPHPKNILKDRHTGHWDWRCFRRAYRHFQEPHKYLPPF